jgi:hypothetical protein
LRPGIRATLLWICATIGVYAILGPLRFPEYLLTSGTAQIRIEAMNGTPEECNSSLFFRHRSSDPVDVHQGFCGAVMTDHGSFKLPESRYYLFGQSRKEIWNKLIEGCVYDVRYFGYRAKVYPGSVGTNRNIPSLVSIDGPQGKCEKKE